MKLVRPAAFFLSLLLCTCLFVSCGGQSAVQDIPAAVTEADIPDIRLPGYAADAETEADVIVAVPAAKPELPQTLPSELPASSYYGYRYLSTLGTAFTNAYTCLAAGIAEMEDTISVEDCHVTQDQFSLVYQCYCDDYPQHFWLSKHMSYSYGEDDLVLSVTPEYTCTKQEKEAMQAEFETAVETMLVGIDAGMSDFEKECIIHDRITHNASYDTTYSADYTYTAFGNLVNRTSVCEGYARAFQYLMYRCNIEALYVSGTGEGIDHGWDMVKLGGEYYHVDVTWDDPVSSSAGSENHEYLNCTETYMLSSGHNITSDSYPIPTASATAYRYHIYYGYTAASLSVDALAAAAAKEAADGITNSFEILMQTPVSQDVLSGFVRENINDLCDRLSAVTGQTVSSLHYSVSTSGYLVRLIPDFG